MSEPAKSGAKPPAAAKSKRAKTGGSEEKKLSPLTRGTVLMAVMFAVGLGWVFMQSKKAKFVPGDETKQNKVKNSMPLIDGNCSTGKARQAQLDKMLNPLTYEPKARQIAVADLKINPFEDYLYRQAVIDKANEPVETEEEKQKRLAEAKKKAEKEKRDKTPPPPVEGMEIQSIISGPRPSAMIAGKIVREGQLIKGWRVVKILPNKVIMRWRTKIYVLKIKKKK